MHAEPDHWSAGQSYELYMGRWSRKVADAFLGGLDPPRHSDWLEIGCGTGALTAAILEATDPHSVLATDPSADFLDHLARTLPDPRLRLAAADARDLPLADGSVDIVVSGLVLNFVQNPAAALREMRRVLRPGGMLGFYVWDYPGEGMEMIAGFWRAVRALDPAAAEALDESRRFPFCTPEGLTALCAKAHLPRPDLAPIEIATDFADFAAFWQPFTLGTGPAPAYCARLDPAARAALMTRLAADLGTTGPVRMIARAWAVRVRLPT